MMAEYRNRHDWFTVAWALAVWAAHFSLLWAASSAFPDMAAARWLALFFTIVAGGALWRLWRRTQRNSAASVERLGVGIAATGIAFGAMPALIG